MVREWHKGRERSIWPAYEMEGNPRKLGDPLLPGFSLFNVAFGHQRSRDTWLPSHNGSHVRSEKRGTDERASMLAIYGTLSFSPSVIFHLLPTVYFLYLVLHFILVLASHAFFFKPPTTLSSEPFFMSRTTCSLPIPSFYPWQTWFLCHLLNCCTYIHFMLSYVFLLYL